MNRNWRGSWGTGLDATIDLGQPMPLAAIRSDDLQRFALGIYAQPGVPLQENQAECPWAC